MIREIYLLLHIQRSTLHYKTESQWVSTKSGQPRTRSYKHLPSSNQTLIHEDMFLRTYMDPEHDR